MLCSFLENVPTSRAFDFTNVVPCYIPLQITNATKLCQDESTFERLGIRTYYPSSDFFNGKRYDDSQVRNCIARMGGITIVKVQASTRYVSQLTRSLRVTFSDQLANFGKVLTKLELKYYLNFE